MATTATATDRIVSYYGTGAAALSEAITPGNRYRVISVMVHLSAAPTSAGAITVTYQPAQGAAYYTALNTQSMVGVTDYYWTPPADLYLVYSDSLVVAYTNPDTVTYGLTVIVEKI